MLAERRLQPREVAQRVAEGGRGDFDIVQCDDRIDLYVNCARVLANDLPMQLARRRHIDDKIADDMRLAAEAPSCRKSPPFGVARLDSTARRDVVLRRCQSEFGELALGDVDLAAPAKTPSAADRVQIDAEPARGLQYGFAGRGFAALSGGDEDDAGGGHAADFPVHHPRINELKTRSLRTAKVPRRNEVGSLGVRLGVTIGFECGAVIAEARCPCAKSSLWQLVSFCAPAR